MMTNKFFDKRFILFFLVLVVLCWLILNIKLDTVGDFFMEAIEPSSLIIAMIVIVIIMIKTVTNHKKQQ